MPTIINHAAQAITTLYNTIFERNDNALYSRLPLTITRTSSSAVSYELGNNAEEDSWWPRLGSGNNEDSKLAELWTDHKRAILLSVGLLSAVVLAVVSLTLKQSEVIGPLVAAALATSCEGTLWNETGWYQHPTVYTVNNSLGKKAPPKKLHPLEFQQRTSQSCADLDF